MRIAFLFNHYLGYQVIHGVPVAFELSRLYPELEVDLLFSTTASRDEAVRIADVYPGHRCRFKLLGSRGLAGMIPGTLPVLHRPGRLWSNRHLLAGYDALIAPEKNYIILKLLPAFRRIKFIGLRHGAGDRPVAFNKGRLRFDYLLVPGQSYYERFMDELPDGHCRIIGYPKFEALEKMHPPHHDFFNNGKPTVLYSPHFHRRQSSWLRMGIDVLSFFAANDEYNLIFAPHARLFKHRRYHGGLGIEKFEKKENILIDTGSSRSYDMSYTRAADIYLGDVSSQVYEFLYYKYRPCVFLNPGQLEAGSMKFWQLGAVIGRIGELENALASAMARQEDTYGTRQQCLVGDAFASDSSPPSERAARAIYDFLME